jgi:hypothetical protein
MIIASFTTIPSRLDKGLPERCIRSLLAQKTPADLILVNIPQVSRKGISYNQARAAALERPGVVINWISQDYGPITKLMGTLEYIERQGIKGARIILVDDDVEYDPMTFGRLITEGGCAAGFVSRDPVVILGHVTSTLWLDSAKVRTKTAFLETYAGVIYNADLFAPLSEFRNWVLSLPSMCQNADDIVIGAWISRRGCQPIRLPSRGVAAQHDAEGTEQLNEINLNGNNTAVLRYFYDYFYFSEWQSTLTMLVALMRRSLMCWWVMALLLVIPALVYKESWMPASLTEWLHLTWLRVRWPKLVIRSPLISKIP